MSDERLAHHVTALIHLRRWHEALSTVDRLLAKDAGNGHAWCQRAVVLVGSARPLEALIAAERAAGLLPDATVPEQLRAIALAEMGRRKPALAAAQRAVALAPDSTNALGVLVGCQLGARRRDDAEATAGRMIALAPDSATSWASLGTVRLAQRRGDEAITAFRHALRLDPTSAEARHGLGRALAATHRRDEAAEVFAQAARTDPHDTESRANLELIASAGGVLLGVFLVVRLLTASAEGPADVAFAIVAALVGLGIVLGVREERTRRLPPDAEQLVRSRRRARRVAFIDRFRRAGRSAPAEETGRPSPEPPSPQP